MKEYTCITSEERELQKLKVVFHSIFFFFFFVLQWPSTPNILHSFIEINNDDDDDFNANFPIANDRVDTDNLVVVFIVVVLFFCHQSGVCSKRKDDDEEEEEDDVDVPK